MRAVYEYCVGKCNWDCQPAKTGLRAFFYPIHGAKGEHGGFTANIF